MDIEQILTNEAKRDCHFEKWYEQLTWLQKWKARGFSPLFLIGLQVGDSSISSKNVDFIIWSLRNEYEAYLKKVDLKVDSFYFCDARNFTIGQWSGETFIYIRFKWGTHSFDKEFHWDDHPEYGTVKPIREIFGIAFHPEFNE